MAACQPSAKRAEKERTFPDNFLVTAEQVGPVHRGMSINDLYEIFPESQIKKIKTKSELTADATDNFYVYALDGKLLLIASPTHANDVNSAINRIILKDTRFETEKGISLNSTVGEIKFAYPDYNFIPSVNEIILFVPEIDGNFEIKRNDLGADVWNDSTGVIAANIPADTRVTTWAIFWTPSKTSIVTKTFWHDLMKRFFNWSLIQLPSILIVILIFIGLLKLLDFSVKRIKKIAINHAAEENTDPGEADKRINTLSGIILGGGRVFLWVIFLLIILGKFNINIAPILASAGIVGLAVGFGAQELVRDFISGFFMLLENQIRTGDVAIINGTGGTVEKIEMRTTTLRDASGVVHIFQNGKINTLSNMTKSWSAMVVEIGVAYKEDTDHVFEVLRQVGSEMQKDPEFGDKMLQAIDIWGIDEFADSAVIIKVKITTKPSQQWAISREFRRRVKKAFDATGIEIPFPHLSLYTGAVTKPMPLTINNVKEGKPDTES